MKIETKPVYACEYCNKMSRSKGAMIRHEAACHKNPKNWTKCFDCKYLTMEDLLNDDGYTRGHQIICKFDGASMAPLRAIRMDFGKEIIDSCDKMMPTLEEGCRNFKKRIISLEQLYDKNDNY